MKFFSGFCLKNEKRLFKEYLEEGLVVAGFSKGAQDALEYVLNSKERVDKLQLFSPAFFDYPQKIIDLNLKAFRNDKNTYIKNFLTKAGLKMENGQWKIENEYVEIGECKEEDLIKLFTFEWEKIDKIKNIKIEIFLGEFDSIIALKKAQNFFKNYGDVYFIKKANHFLRRVD
ncbi:pimelyl-ACP methyl ester esterase BioV [Caminibacter sp.]